MGFCKLAGSEEYKSVIEALTILHFGFKTDSNYTVYLNV